jgi:ATP-dependent Clp protease ATP-binding subunit ClpB
VHLLAAFCDLQESLLIEVCKQKSLLQKLRERVKAAISSLPKLSSASGDLRMSRELGRVFADARKLSEEAGDQFVAEEWVLLSLLRDSELSELTRPLGLTPELIEAGSS